MKISKKEFKYIIYATLFSFIVIGLIIPAILNSGKIDSFSPFMQFLIFNIGIFIFLQLFLSAVITGTKVKLTNGLGLLTLFMALDMLAPPFSVSTSGVLSSDLTLGGSASDYFIGNLWISLGVTGFPVYLLTYVLTPFILLLISAWILKDISKNLPN